MPVPSGAWSQKICQFQLYFTSPVRQAKRGTIPSPVPSFAARRACLLLIILLIARVGRVCDDFLELGAHRHVEVDALGRNRLQEPLLVDGVDLAGLVEV